MIQTTDRDPTLEYGSNPNAILRSVRIVNRTRVGGLFLMVAPAWSVLVTVVAGARYPGYSHVSNFISALGSHGARDGAFVSWADFAVVGTLIGLGGLLVWPRFSAVPLAAGGVALAGVSTTLGYVGSAAYRCDFGCPEANYSATQSVHFAVSAADLVGLAIGIALVAWALRTSETWRWLSQFSVVIAIVVSAGANLLLLPSVDDVAGLVQRVVELASYAWFFVIGRTAYANGTEYAQAA